MNRIKTLTRKLGPLVLMLGFLGAAGSACAATSGGSSTSCGPTGSSGQTIFESSGFTSAGCLFTTPTTADKAWCGAQNLTTFLPTNSGTCLICVQAKYAALVANDTLNQEAKPGGYIYLPTPFSETALTLDPSGISYFDGVHTPFRCLKCTQPPAGMTAWWTLDQWAGGPMLNAAPATKNTLNGNPVGTAIVTGESGNAEYFNGSAYIDVASTPNDSAHVDVGLGDFSIEAWVKVNNPADSSGTHIIVEKLSKLNRPIYAYPGGYSFFLYDGSPFLYLGGPYIPTTPPGWFGTYSAPSLVVPPDGHWHFVAVSVARTTNAGGIQFTLDGASVQSPLAPVAYSLTNVSNLRIGMSTLGTTGGFVGSIDEVAFFNRALAPNEFQSTYNAKCYGKCK